MGSVVSPKGFRVCGESVVSPMRFRVCGESVVSPRGFRVCGGSVVSPWGFRDTKTLSSGTRELHYIVGTKRSAARISLERPPESLCNAGLILEDFLCLIDRSNPHSPFGYTACTLLLLRGAQKRHMCVASLALV